MSLRFRLLLSGVLAVAVVLAALTVGFNVVLRHRLDSDARGVLQSRVSAELSALRVRNGRILLPEAPDDSALDSQIWVFEDDRVLERPSSGVALEDAANGLAGGPRRVKDVPGAQFRLYAVPVVSGGSRLGTVVTGISLRPYEQTARTALIASIIVAALALTTATLAAWWLISRALRPVARMTAQAAEWSERDLGRRFSLGTPRDELTQLAATLDALLDRLAASFQREQRFSAEVSHELRTPLANVIAESQFALRHAREDDEYRAGFEQVLQSASRMNRTLETLLSAARAELDPQRSTSDAADGARAAVEASAAPAAERGIELLLELPATPARVAAEAEVVERILAPLLENACRHARERARLSVARDGSAVAFAVEDDGPGVPAGDSELIFEPGRRSSQRGSTVVATAGAGLGLALARRLAQAADGDVKLAAGASGALFVVRLPAA